MKKETEIALQKWEFMMNFYTLDTEELKGNFIAVGLYINHVKKFIEILDNDPEVLDEIPGMSELYKEAKRTVQDYEEACKSTGFAVAGK